MVKLAKLALAVALVAVGSQARAGFVPTLTGTTYNAGTNSTLVTYSLNFTTNATQTETLGPGNFVTLYDVYGAGTTFTAGTASPNVTFSTQATGVTPAGVTPTDSAALNNITFTYTDGTLNTDTTFTVSFTLSGDFSQPALIGQYTSIDNIPIGTNNQIGPVQIPNAIPEPASLTMVGLGLVGGLVALRRRRNA